MKHLPLFGLLLLLALPAQAQKVFAGVYGTETTFPFELWSTDGLSLDGAQSDGGTDAQYRCGTGAEAATTNDYTDEGTSYSIVLTATEMQCSGVITVFINEAVDAIFYVQTMGNASAQFTGIQQTGDAFARLGAPAGASHAADVAAVKAETAAIVADTGTDGVVVASGSKTGYALSTAGLNALRDLTIEDQGSGVSLACALAVLLAYAAGDISTSGSDTTYEDPSGAETRIAGTVASAGNRTTSITCPSF